MTPTPVIPTTYRWISSSRVDTARTRKEKERGEEPEPRTMSLSFSVPITALPPVASDAQGAMDVDEPPEPARRNVGALGCDVPGCSERRKYRLVRDFRRGACGMAHLKVLEAQHVGSV